MCSLLVATLLIASVLASRAGAARGAKDASRGAVPAAFAPKDTTPPGTVQNLRRTDTAPKAMSASGKADRP